MYVCAAYGVLMTQNWREVKRGSADVMAFDVDAGEVEGGASLSVEDEEGMITGDEIFNRCINATLEAQEVRHIPYRVPFSHDT